MNGDTLEILDGDNLVLALSEKLVDNAMHIKRRVNNMVDELDCRDHHVPSCWADFVNRGYSEVRRVIEKELGDKAVRDFEYYFNYLAYTNTIIVKDKIRDHFQYSTQK